MGVSSPLRALSAWVEVTMWRWLVGPRTPSVPKVVAPLRAFRGGVKL